MRTPAPPTRRSLLLGWTYFAASAAFVAVGVHFAIEVPLVGLVLALVVVAVAVPRLRARRRFRELVMNGDINGLLSAWEPNLDDDQHAPTIGPLMRATALAAHGLACRSRQVLDLAKRGPAWDEALEHRLFLDTLLACCEGHRKPALETARQMDSLPLPASRWERSRAITLRAATLAMARAFGGQSCQEDAQWLRMAARQNPLLVWPMRYAEAITQLRLGRHETVRKLLRTAPRWPKDSAFRVLSGDLSKELERAAR